MNSLFKPLRAAVEDLHGIRFGLKHNKLAIEGLKSGSLQSTDECDRFKLCFPVAGNTTTWEVVFDRQTPLIPPDIVVGVGDEEFCPSLDSLEGYVQWDPASSTCLSKLLSELIKEYSIYQKDSLSYLPSLKQQWIDLCQSTNYAKACEVHIVKNPPGTYNSSATFLFELLLDLSDIPPYLIKDNPGENTAALQVTFGSPDLTKITPRLFLSARVENAIGGQAALRLPVYGNSDLKSYLEKIDTLLANTIKDVRDRFIKRKEMLAYLIAEFHGSVIEYDMEKFSDVSLLLSHNNFFFVLFVCFDESFPENPPSLVVQSVYHTSAKGPFRHTYRDYLYSPRWEAKKTVQSIREHLTNSIMDFKDESVRACK